MYMQAGYQDQCNTSNPKWLSFWRKITRAKKKAQSPHHFQPRKTLMIIRVICRISTKGPTRSSRIICTGLSLPDMPILPHLVVIIPGRNCWVDKV
ncbi:hypothetical protein PHJA_000171100 [Phtheirospermum japonicum]|uniref:Uncharacterized protein n=1 Tax=Phtheirospermum japonicum TaxID=374723 RepID=A0A830AZY8_9LAMI|nr:hypothetical protein PHJA_000171100 [Phtheirospermum japonicum]